MGEQTKTTIEVGDRVTFIGSKPYPNGESDLSEEIQVGTEGTVVRVAVDPRATYPFVVDFDNGQTDVPVYASEIALVTKEATNHDR